MVEFIGLEDVKGLQTMPRHCHVFKSGLFSIISESISSQSCFFCNTDLQL